MNNILLFGAGKSATVLIEYLLEQCGQNGWHLTVVDADEKLAQSKVNNHAAGTALSFNVRDDAARAKYVSEASLVISMLPPALHLLVAQECIAWGKHLLTASYIDAGIEALRSQIEEKGLLFLCEMGLDPGIDHMSAKKLLDEIQSNGGKVTSFVSHCGGLVAPESDNNPWHYKISWNPRNVVMAGQDGAVFKEKGQTVQWHYEQLFSEKRPVQVADTTYCWYPNRDSLRYLPIYGLEDCPTFMRTTLRHPDFIFGWAHLLDLGLTRTEPLFDTDGLSLRDFFQQHFKMVHFDQWLQQKLAQNLQQQEAIFEQFEKGTGTAAEKDNTSQQLQTLLYESGLLLDQLDWLGVKDSETIINKGRCSPADVLQLMLEQKLALQPGDRDLVVMQHEIEYVLEGKTLGVKSSLVLEGKDDAHTAMAATVGLPLGIAAVLLLKNELTLRGLHIPVLPQIYEPVLRHLAAAGIQFQETANAG